jgi:hypothetical protein
MPTFTDHAGADRNLRVLPAFAPPLPRAPSTPPSGTGASEPSNPEGCYDVVIVGVRLLFPLPSSPPID